MNEATKNMHPGVWVLWGVLAIIGAAVAGVFGVIFAAALAYGVSALVNEARDAGEPGDESDNY